MYESMPNIILRTHENNRPPSANAPGKKRTPVSTNDLNRKKKVRFEDIFDFLS